MNWGRIIGGGVAAGIVTWLADGFMHGYLLADAYKRYSEAFSQEPTPLTTFLAVSVVVGIFTAVLFGKSRGSWGAGAKGGATFGLYLGLAYFFMNFYMPLVIDGFPYYLAWCHGGIGLIDGVLAGAVLGAIIPKP